MAEIKVKGRRAKLDGRVAVTPRRKPGEQTEHTNLGPEIEYGKRRKGGKCGRPTDYRSVYCDQLRRYFADADAWQVNYSYKGAAQVIPRNKMPTFGRFAAEIGVGVACLYRWARAHEEFAEAMADAMELQKTFLMEAGGVTIAAGFATFLLKANHGVRDDVPLDDDEDDNGDVVVEPTGKGQGD